MKTPKDKNKTLHVAQNAMKKQEKLDIYVVSSRSVKKGMGLNGQVEPERMVCYCVDEQQSHTRLYE